MGLGSCLEWKKLRLQNERELGQRLALPLPLRVSLRPIASFSVPQFPYLYNGDEGTYLMVLL